VGCRGEEVRLQELVEVTGQGDYVVTVNVFPGRLDGVAVDIVIPEQEWHTQSAEDIAARYLAAAIRAVKGQEGKGSKLWVAGVSDRSSAPPKFTANPERVVTEHNGNTGWIEVNGQIERDNRPHEMGQ
jgi:hypothetical protein